MTTPAGQPHLGNKGWMLDQVWYKVHFYLKSNQFISNIRLKQILILTPTLTLNHYNCKDKRALFFPGVYSRGKPKSLGKWHGIARSTQGLTRKVSGPIRGPALGRGVRTNMEVHTCTEFLPNLQNFDLYQGHFPERENRKRPSIKWHYGLEVKCWAFNRETGV